MTSSNFYSLKIFWIQEGLVLAIIVGLASAIFVKYGIDYIFPKPPQNDDGGAF